MVRFNARSVTLPLFVVGVPPYTGTLALYDAIQGAAKALQAQRAA